MVKIDKELTIEALHYYLNKLLDDKKYCNDIKFLVNKLQDVKITGWERYKRIGEDSFQKVKVYENKKLDYDIYVITWDGHQKSKLHDHGKGGCVYKILEGNLTEHLYSDKLNTIGLSCYVENDTNYIDNKRGYHIMANYFNKACCSLHIYMPANYEGNIFEPVEDVME